MKKFLAILCLSLCEAGYADTINLQWMNTNNTTFQNSTCTTGGNLNVPSTHPTKYGYDFVGWRAKPARELEYVTFQAGAYIDTGIKFDSDEIKYEMKLEIPSSQAYRVAFGAEGTCSGSTQISNSAGSLYIGGNPNSRNFAVGSRKINGSISSQPNTYSLYIKKTIGSIIASIDDTTFNNTVAGTITTDKNIRIGQVTDDSQYCGFGAGSMYYFKIIQNGVLVRDFIPALDPDGIACFYDNVTKTFFYIHGPDLIAGPLKE